MRGLRQKIAFAHDIIMAMLSIPISLFLRLGNEIFYYEIILIVRFLIQKNYLFQSSFIIKNLLY